MQTVDTLRDLRQEGLEEGPCPTPRSWCPNTEEGARPP